MASGTPDYLKDLQAILNSPTMATTAPLVAAPVAAPAPLAAPVVTSSASVTSSAAQKGARKLKFMLVSTHCHQFTGYSKVSYGILKELSKVPWLSVTHFGFQKIPMQQAVPSEYRPYPSGIDIIDAAAGEKPFEQGFGFKQLPDAIRRVKPDVVMIFNDMSVVGKFIMEIEKSGIPKTFRTWVYCDQVYTMQLQGYIDMLNMKAERIFTFTPYWKQCLKDQGVNRPMDVLLHGFEKEFFRPLPRNEIRKQMKIPEEAFVFLNVNRNQPRKRYDILIMAFAELIVKYPTKPSVLMCICDKGEKGGWWLFEIFRRELQLLGVNVEQFANRLMISSSDMTFKDEDINVFYNLADVGVNAAEGEGWGLCNFEQMGVGIPQVVPDVGGFKEFCRSDNSVLVKPKFRYYLPSVYSPVGGEAAAMDPHDLCLGMEEYLLDSSKRKAHGEAAKALVQTYTWERGCEPLIRRLRQEKEDVDAEN